MSDCIDERIKISWSQLQAFELCSHRANLIRQGKKGPATDIRNFFHGTVCDRVMRAWLSQESPGLGEMPEMVDDYIIKCLDEAKETGDGVVRWRNSQDRKIVTLYCKDILSKLEPMLVKLVLPYDYEPEFRFKIPVRIPYLDNKTLVEIYLTGGIFI